MKTNTNILIKNLLFLLPLAGLWLLGCERFDKYKGVKEVTPVTVSVDMHVIRDIDEPMPPNMTVRFTNAKENLVTEVTSDASLKVTAQGLVPGIYTITAYSAYNDGVRVWRYSGSAGTSQMLVEEKAHFDIDVKIGRTGPLAIKELFYSGSRMPGNTYYYDQFYEIYNNSESTVYLDSLCISIIFPLTATPTLPIWNDPDWEQYVYAASACFQVPGNGTDYPLEPGESIIMAQLGINHQLPENNPTSPVNLISAEFEFWRFTATFPVDQPAINMEQVWGNPPNPAWLTTVMGGAFVIFRQTGPVDRNFTAVTTDAPTVQHLKIKRKDVIDAVECVNNTSVLANKRMPVELDAGATTVGGTYNTLSVVRKVDYVRSNGTYVFQDTNNSTDDFEVMTPEIRRYNPKIPKWNTWHSLDPQFP